MAIYLQKYKNVIMRMNQLELFRYKQNFRYLLIIIITSSMLFLTGCMKIEDEDVEVIIVDTYYEEGSDYYYLIGGTIGCDSVDDEYYIIVDYNGIRYTVEDEFLYEK